MSEKLIDTYTDRHKSIKLLHDTIFVHGIDCDHANSVCVHNRLEEAEKAFKDYRDAH